MQFARTLVLAQVFLFSSYSHALPELGQKVMITSCSREASEAGKTIASNGGNAVDVAVATALALAVTRPYYAALGGGGFALIKMGKSIEAIDFRETAPKATSPQYYLSKAKNASVDGGTAVGIPGIPMGLWQMHKKYGKLRWSELFGPAISLASKGFQITGEWNDYTNKTADRFNPFGKSLFLRKDGKAFLPGDTLKQPGLAKLLGELRTRGASAMYKGPAAKDIIESIKAAGGDMTLADLADYKVRWLKPLETDFNGYHIYLMPPPSSGGIVVGTALRLAEKLQVLKKSPLEVSELHLFSEILARAFRGRVLLGDPDFHKNPNELLLSDKYVDFLAKSVSEKKSKTMEPLDDKKLKEETETTHLSVMDVNGDGIAMTVTLNGAYGSAVVTKTYGVALNNEMDDFTTRPNEPNQFGLIQGAGNEVEPGKRPLSSMSPTLAFKNGKLVESVGSPGGPRIISAVFQVLYRTLANRWDMDRAIQAPRVHHQFLPNTLFLDPGRFPLETIEELKKRGHSIEEKGPIAKVYGIQLRDDGLLEGAFDARGEGGAVGF